MPGPPVSPAVPPSPPGWARVSWRRAGAQKAGVAESPRVIAPKQDLQAPTSVLRGKGGAGCAEASLLGSRDCSSAGSSTRELGEAKGCSWVLGESELKKPWCNSEDSPQTQGVPFTGRWNSIRLTAPGWPGQHGCLRWSKAGEPLALDGGRMLDCTAYGPGLLISAFRSRALKREDKDYSERLWNSCRFSQLRTIEAVER